MYVNNKREPGKRVGTTNLTEADFKTSVREEAAVFKLRTYLKTRRLCVSQSLTRYVHFKTSFSNTY